MFTGSFQLRASSVPRLRARQLCYSVASALMTNICVNLQPRRDVPTLRISVMVLGMYGGGFIFCIQIKTRSYYNNPIYWNIGCTLHNFISISKVEVKQILAGNIILALMEWGVTGERKPNCLCRLQLQTLSLLCSPRPEDWHYEIATDWSPAVAQEACSHSCFLRQVELKFWDLGFAGCANRLHCSIVSPTMGVHTSYQ